MPRPAGCLKPMSSERIAHRGRVATLLAGVAALLWLLLRTGAKPHRAAYPCQQAAASVATLAFGGTVVSGLLLLRRKVPRSWRAWGAAALAFTGLTAAWGTWRSVAPAPASAPGALVREDYRAAVYHVVDCPQAPAGDRFTGLDTLLSVMGREGRKLYRSDRTGLLSGPDGLVAADDVVIVKINYQWGERGGTNTDLLRGLLHRLLDHPDGFRGEIVVCENTQFVAPCDLDRAANNAEDIAQSPHDVVADFQAAGAPVTQFDWTTLRQVSVAEYSAGDLNDGYVVYPYDARWQGRLSYPKFRTERGAYVSMRDGVWSPQSATYDRARLKVINLPVLKHHMIYGLTGCVKHYMGLVTGALNTNAHAGVAYGALGAVMGELGPPDLNILDCIWVGGDPCLGPAFPYADAVRRDELVASLDPVAADMWAARHVLLPAFADNGYAPPWPAPSADPDDPASAFRRYLDASMAYLLAAGVAVTNDFNRIDAFTATARADGDGDGDIDLRDAAVLQRCAFAPAPLPPECGRLDLAGDGAVDVGDSAAFMDALTGPADLP